MPMPDAHSCIPATVSLDSVCVPPKPQPRPLVSVVVPVYNAAGSLPHCLGALLAQTYPSERYEIIIVDDGSTDASAVVAHSCLDNWEGVTQVIQKPNAGPASARNRGIEAASGDIVAFIDSDCVAEREWLMRLTDVFRASDDAVAGVGGPIINHSPPGWVSSYLQAANFYRHRMRRGVVDYLVTGNVAFRRSALLAVGGFAVDEGVWGEDADLSFRLRQLGYVLLLTQQGTVTHFGSPTSLRGLIKELYRYGYGSSVLARNWTRARQPDVQLIRHAVAAVLSPALALSYVRSVGLLSALSFCPLVAVEHLAFCVGLIDGIRHEVHGGEDGHGARVDGNNGEAAIR